LCTADLPPFSPQAGSSHPLAQDWDNFRLAATRPEPRWRRASDAGGRLRVCLPKRKTKKKPSKATRTAGKKVTPRKKVADKKRAIPKKKSTKKPVPKKAAVKTKAVGKRAIGAKTASVPKKQVREKSQSVDIVAFSPEGPEARSGWQSGDLQGLSRVEGADSESVGELLEEGNAFEADVVTGVEDAGNADEKEVRTHEVSEDDVPGEYLDK
jgi:hypothetical protein